jgi:hypothetical protein
MRLAIWFLSSINSWSKISAKNGKENQGKEKES